VTVVTFKLLQAPCESIWSKIRTQKVDLDGRPDVPESEKFFNGPQIMNLNLIKLIVLSLVTGALLISSKAVAQEEQSETVVAVPVTVVDKGPEDALERGNPRSSIVGYLNAASEFDWEKAAEYLDIRNLPSEIEEVGGPELARQLNHVISRSVWLDQVSVSDKPDGLQGDGLPSYRDLLVTVTGEDGDVPLWMQKVPRADGVMIWKLSNRSVAKIPELYDYYSYPAPVEKIRSWFPEDSSFLGLEAFKWFIMIVTGLACWPVFYLVGILLARVFSSPEKEIYPLIRKVFTGPAVFIGILITLSIFLDRLGTGAQAQEVIRAKTLSIFALVWVLWAISNLVKTYQQEKLNKAGRPGAAKLMQPLTTLAKILIFIFGVLFWLNNIGVNITTLIAGLGVGGLAVALALQKPIEDMMGALTIFSQASMRVGDFCRYGQEVGIVEEIGLRTTRFRTLTNTVVSIPNARIASVEVENLSYRTKIRYWPTLRLRYDTTPEQMQAIMDKIKTVLEQNEMVYEEPLRVRFTDFEDDAMLIKVHSFIKTTEFDEFLAVAESINFQIMDIVKSAGTSFALPGRAIFMEGDKA
jgi:MscS family membrane protein